LSADKVQLSQVEHLPLIPGWDPYDWQMIFENTNFNNLGPDHQAEPPSPEDVDEVLHQYTTVEGNDYQDTDMVAVMRLKDGTFASVHAGNDTTGWGCHGDYTIWYIGDSLADVAINGLTNESRSWLGTTL
jgi:hypothetical protein